MKTTKPYCLLILSSLFFYTTSCKNQANTQKKSEPRVTDSTFTGAAPVLQQYKVVYQLNSADTNTIKGTLRNIQNALKDPRLAHKLQVELVVFSGGVAVFKKNSGFKESLQKLQAQGVILAQCLNTMHERHIAKEELYSFISYVPSGNGELIIRQQQGWAIIHP